MNGAISVVAGSTGRLSYKRSVVGPQLVERPLPKDANTPAQRASRLDFSKGNAGWKSLTKPERKLWDFAAKSRKRRDDVTGEMYALQGRTYFIGLASKFAQINPGQNLPATPPITPFYGDNVTFTLSVSDGMAVAKGDRANAAGVKTEFAVKRLPSLEREPGVEGYVTESFVEINVGDALEAVLDLGPGIWGIGAKFVNPATGEETALVPLGTLVLGLAVVKGGEAETAAPAKRRKAA